MSAPGHCRHCEEGCTGDTPILGWPDDEPHTDDNGATWPGGDCPACDEAERTLADYFEARRAERRRELVESWKANQSYPFEGEPQTEEERVERATFDVVATAARRHIPRNKNQERLTLGLLKDTLQRNPEGVKTLLGQYAGLTEAEEEELQDLLVRTPLSRLIRATSHVTDRLDFLSALRVMVFDPESKGLVKERDNLHRVLERESWVFGEQFHMMSSEIGLTNALRHHLRLLGREDTPVTPVTKVDGTQGRLDLMFSVAAKEQDRNRHLVVELKAPHVVAGSKEAAQIKDYARAIVEDPQFAGTHTVWDFMLVVNDYDRGVQKDINQVGRPRGILDESEIDPDSPVSYRVWVRRWSEVLESADKRMLYYKDNLAHDPSLADIRRRAHRGVGRAQGRRPMSAPGHCRHCHHLCPGGDEEYVGNGAYVREHCSVDDEAQWSDGHCPACDEAERIAAECDRLAKPCCERHERIHGPQSDAYEHIADFARGDA